MTLRSEELGPEGESPQQQQETVVHLSPPVGEPKEEPPTLMAQLDLLQAETDR